MGTLNFNCSYCDLPQQYCQHCIKYKQYEQTPSWCKMLDWKIHRYITIHCNHWWEGTGLNAELYFDWTFVTIPRLSHISWARQREAGVACAMRTCSCHAYAAQALMNLTTPVIGQTQWHNLTLTLHSSLPVKYCQHVLPLPITLPKWFGPRQHLEGRNTEFRGRNNGSFLCWKS